MAVLITRPPSVRFVMVRNEWARDRRLSLKAVGLLTYLHSHEDGYRLSLAQIIRDHTDGKDAVGTGLDELESNGYLARVRARANGGQWGETDYVLADPFDAHGRIIRQLPAEEERETRRSGLPAPGNPRREIRPIEDQQTEHQESPSDSPPLFAVTDEERQGPTFDDFWAAYPKKVGKDAARRAWAKAVRRDDPAKIVDVVRRYPFRPDKQFVKDPATWLNAGCWTDDLDTVAAANRPRTVGAHAYSAAPYRDPDPADYHGGF